MSKNPSRATYFQINYFLPTCDTIRTGKLLNPFHNRSGTLPNSEDPDEMPHNVVFYQDLHCLLRQKQS